MAPHKPHAGHVRCRISSSALAVIEQSKRAKAGGLLHIEGPRRPQPFGARAVSMKPPALPALPARSPSLQAAFVLPAPVDIVLTQAFVDRRGEQHVAESGDEEKSDNERRQDQVDGHREALAG